MPILFTRLSFMLRMIVVSLALLCLLSVSAGAGRLQQVLQGGPYSQFQGTVLRQQVGNLTVGAWSHPAAADWDGDGDGDIIAGSGYGDLMYYERRDDGGLASGVQMMPAESRFFHHPPSRNRVSPAIGDWDGDGRPDIIVGAGGRIHLYLCTATGFSRGRRVRVDGSAVTEAINKSVGEIGHVVPAVGDIDSDGDPDLMLGDDRGRLWAATNDSSGTGVALTDLRRMRGMERKIDTNGQLCPAVGDWNGDGRIDILIGTRNRILAFLGNGRGLGEARTVYSPSAAADNAARAGTADPAPAFYCPEGGDGPEKLLVGERRGFIAVIERTENAQAQFGRYVTMANAPIDVGRTAAVCPVDWDGDGAKDIVAGGEDGFLRLFQCIDRQQLRFSEGHRIEDSDGPIRGRPREGLAGHLRYAWPCVTDADGDGDLDLLVAQADGRIALWLNDGGFTPAGPISVGDEPVSMSGIATVSSSDYDDDGDADLFVGTRLIPHSRVRTNIAPQTVIYLENKATKQGSPPRFTKAVRINAVLSRPEGSSAISDGDILGMYSMQPTIRSADGKTDFLVNTRLGVYVFGLRARANNNIRLELTAGARGLPRPVLPQFWSCHPCTLNGRGRGLLCGSQHRGWIVWYAQDELTGDGR